MLDPQATNDRASQGHLLQGAGAHLREAPIIKDYQQAHIFGDEQPARLEALDRQHALPYDAKLSSHGQPAPSSASSIKLGPHHAKNRIVSTPHGAPTASRGGLTDRYIRYTRRRPRAAAGRDEFGSSSIPPHLGERLGEINNWDDSIIPQFQEMSTAIHRHGALCLSQIFHRGRRGTPGTRARPVGPSDTREERHPASAPHHDQDRDPRG